MTAVTVQILVRRASAVEGTLPQLAQVGVDKTVAVCGSAQAVRKGATATGAIACRWLGAAVAGPHQAILFVMKEKKNLLILFFSSFIRISRV